MRMGMASCGVCVVGLVVGGAAVASAQTHQRVSRAADGTPANFAGQQRPAISANGRFVVFVSRASNLVPNDTNDDFDVFRKDLVTGEVVRVSVGNGGVQGDDASGLRAGGGAISSAVDISADGNLVVFNSDANNFSADLTEDNLRDVFLRDIDGATTTLISTSDTGGIHRGGVNPQISDDGSVIVFESAAELAGPELFNTVDKDIFRYTVADGSLFMVSSNDGVEADPGGDSTDATVSPDGSIIAYTTRSAGLAAGASPTTPRTIVRTGVGTHETYADRGEFSFSADNQRWAFSTTTSLAVADDDAVADIYVEDRSLTTITLVSFGGDEGNLGIAAAGPKINADGTHVVFSSTGTYFDANPNALSDALIYELETDTLSLVSAPPSGNTANGLSDFPDISGDGTLVTYRSSASNLVDDGVTGAHILATLVGSERADLTVSIDTIVVADGQAQITVTVSNKGPSGIHEFSLSLALDGGTLISSELGSVECAASGDVITCSDESADPNASVLENGDARTLTFVVQYAESGDKTVVVTGASSPTDPDLDNNEAVSEFTIPPLADLALTVEATKLNRDNVRFVYTVVNLGPDDLEDEPLILGTVTSEAVISAELVSGSGSTLCTGDLGVDIESSMRESDFDIPFACPIDVLAVGASASITIDVNVANRSSFVETHATLESGPDPDLSNNEATGRINSAGDPGGCQVALAPGPRPWLLLSLVALLYAAARRRTRG